MYEYFKDDEFSRNLSFFLFLYLAAGLRVWDFNSLNVRKKVKYSIVSSSGDNDKRGHLNSKNADKGVLNGVLKNKIFEKGI